jgi:hypothetical protein
MAYNTKTSNFNFKSNVGINTATANASLDMSQKTDGILLPQGSSAQRPSSPPVGTLRWNTDLNSIEYYTASGWTTSFASSTSLHPFLLSGM